MLPVVLKLTVQTLEFFAGLLEVRLRLLECGNLGVQRGALGLKLRAFVAESLPFFGDTRRLCQQISLPGGDRRFIFPENGFAAIKAFTLGLKR